MLENQKRIDGMDILRISQMFPIQPLFNKVIITLNTDEVDGQLVFSENTMSEEQYIVAIGTHVHEVAEADKVIIDLEKLTVREMNPNNTHEFLTHIKLDPIMVDGVAYAMIDDRFIKAKYRK